MKRFLFHSINIIFAIACIIVIILVFGYKNDPLLPRLLTVIYDNQLSLLGVKDRSIGRQSSVEVLKEVRGKINQNYKFIEYKIFLLEKKNVVMDMKFAVWVNRSRDWFEKIFNLHNEFGRIYELDYTFHFTQINKYEDFQSLTSGYVNIREEKVMPK